MKSYFNMHPRQHGHKCSINVTGSQLEIFILAQLIQSSNLHCAKPSDGDYARRIKGLLFFFKSTETQAMAILSVTLITIMD